VERPRIQYARRDGVSLAYQATGAGPDLLLVAGAASLTVAWEEPLCWDFLAGIGEGVRLITFDQRGAGRSDPLGNGQVLPLEERVADFMAVVEAAGADRPFLVATHDGGPVALLAATTHPDAFRGLALVNTAARQSAAPDFPEGLAEDGQAWFVDALQERWGTGFTMELWAPSWGQLADGRERWARLEAASASRAQAVLQTKQTFATDARDLLPLVTIPTLVVQRRDDPSAPAGHGRYLADRIPDATYVELPGGDHMPFSGDSSQIVGAVRMFVLGRLPEADAGARRLAAVAFTDIVGSTEAARRLGDARWVQLLDVHDAVTRRIAGEEGGRVVKSTGDGVLAVFDGPAGAVRFGRAVGAEVAALGLDVRCGIHAGEIHARGDDVAGLAVHAAARIAGLAGAGDVVVSRAVVDLTAGAGYVFDDHGTHELKGLDGTWELYRVTST
jgi:pimeloyl-ACP methyl ester carboxylesterase